MAAPTALPETYVPCLESIFTIGTTPDTATLKVIDGGYTLSFGVDEMTNNQSGAAYEDVKTYQTMTGQFTCAWVAGTPPVFKAGDLFNIVIDNENENGPYFSGKVRFNEVQNPVLDVKAGLKFQFSIRNQGAITTTRPGP